LTSSVITVNMTVIDVNIDILTVGLNTKKQF